MRCDWCDSEMVMVATSSCGPVAKAFFFAMAAWFAISESGALRSAWNVCIGKQAGNAYASKNDEFSHGASYQSRH